MCIICRSTIFCYVLFDEMGNQCKLTEDHYRSSNCHFCVTLPINCWLCNIFPLNSFHVNLKTSYVKLCNSKKGAEFKFK
jgi:hypothetical protein